MAGNICYLGGKLVQLSGVPMTLPTAATDPSSAVAGDQYFNITSNTIRYYNGVSWGNAAGSGSVTSVALSDGSTSPLYSVSGSPITTSGTLSFTLSTQSPNLVLAGPSSGAAAQPTMRALVAADIPNLSSLYESVSNFASRSYVSGVTLAASTTVATTIPAFTFAFATYGSLEINYQMLEATTSARRRGRFSVCTDGTNVGYADNFTQSVQLGSGIVLSAVISSTNINVQFLGTGANAVTMKAEAIYITA